MSQAATTTVEPDVQPEAKTKATPKTDKRPKRQPPYHVLLWNDDDHTYEYVIKMLRELFGHEVEKGFQLADQVHRQGKAVVLTTTREHAELKRDQIYAYGKDPGVRACKGSMAATIEPAQG